MNVTKNSSVVCTKKIFRRFVLLAVLSLGGLGNTNAATIVSWGPATDIIATGQQNLTVGQGSASLSFASYASPTVGSNYYPNYVAEGATPNFYGSRYYYEVNTANPSGHTGSPMAAITTSTTDYITTTRNFGTLASNGTTAAQLYAISMWAQADFLDGSSGDVTLNGMSITTSDNGGLIATTQRFVIELNSTFYISQSYGESTRSFSDPTLVSWFNYDPSTDFSIIGSAATLAASDFDHLTAAGFMTLSSYTGGGTISTNTSAFSVLATAAVPEPSTYVLLGMGLAGLWFLRRGKSRV